MTRQMWRAVAGFRILTLVYAGVLIIKDHRGYAHPAGGDVALAAMAVWTVITMVAYATPRGRQPWLICADVAVAALLILSTRLIDTTSRINAGAPTIPVSWVAASVLTCAVACGPTAGLAGAAVTVSGPAGAVLLAEKPARALAAATGEAWTTWAGTLAPVPGPGCWSRTTTAR